MSRVFFFANFVGERTKQTDSGLFSGTVAWRAIFLSRFVVRTNRGRILRKEKKTHHVAIKNRLSIGLFSFLINLFRTETTDRGVLRFIRIIRRRTGYFSRVMWLIYSIGGGRRMMVAGKIEKQDDIRISGPSWKCSFSFLHSKESIENAFSWYVKIAYIFLA